ncbi:homoserine kinase [Actinoalloteichus hymeniacidonis]|uniref:Homoserine kinase n=1 Tax=Actinoalloteichus hymeniacidonis TaxID=340345 RepID=A0AAC9HN76_9PSEU|nr:homoserine kinase [Actinoalloteichus hymeniacidonis]AOS62268.1 homoserine kinase [Actinoalloteichus hymeniacidonis]MBB5909706.1 homoserine kinase [Actinoalloteichus hymeniacidonis]
MTRLRITVPASTANLGSGFDALGLALGWHDVVTVETAPAGLLIEIEGAGAGVVPLDERHLLFRAVQAAVSDAGESMPGLIIRCANTIPHSRGLGSSAAAVVAGIAAGFALVGRALDERALDLAARFEGHADNAAASLLGGLVIAWRDGAEGPFRALRLEPHAALRPVVLVPATESATAVTRGLLPERVPLADASFALGRSSLAVAALTGHPELLLAATEDRLHQRHRAAAWPDTMALVTALRAAGVPAAVSGAGPTVFALPADGVLPEDVDLAGFSAYSVPVDTTGVRISIE